MEQQLTASNDIYLTTLLTTRLGTYSSSSSKQSRISQTRIFRVPALIAATPGPSALFSDGPALLHRAWLSFSPVAGSSAILEHESVRLHECLACGLGNAVRNRAAPYKFCLLCSKSKLQARCQSRKKTRGCLLRSPDRLEALCRG